MPAATTKKRPYRKSAATGRYNSRASTSRRSRTRAARTTSTASNKLAGNEIIAALKTKIRENYTIPDELIPDVYQTLLRMLREALVTGRSVGFKNVGTLEPYRTRPQRYRHPKTKELERSDPSTRIRFVMSPNLKEDLNG